MKNVYFYELSLTLRSNVLFFISNIQHKTDPSLIKAKILCQKLFSSAAVCSGLLRKVKTVVPADPPSVMTRALRRETTMWHTWTMSTHPQPGHSRPEWYWPVYQEEEDHGQRHKPRGPPEILLH